MSNRVTDHFPKLNITPRYPQKHDLSDRETIEQFLARGGQIEEVPTGVATKVEGGKKLTQKEITELRKKADVAKAKQIGRDLV